MGSSPLIVDISSDEESDDGNGRPDSFLDWIDDFLDDDPGSSDVMVLDELPSGIPDGRKRGFSEDEPLCYLFNPKRSCLSMPTGSPDEDCVVLDGDPDKPDPVLEKGCDDSDDLVVIGEKGPVACRDFPHSRHLCVKFPFATTPHEKFCDLCHCYVCDVRAPCAYWGTGGSPGDHCHSSDRKEKWKIQRENFKLGHFQPAVPLTPTKTSISVASTMHDPVVVSLTQCRMVSPIPLQPPGCMSNRPIIHPPVGFVESLPSIIRRKRDTRAPLSHSRNAFPQVLCNKDWLPQRVPRPRRIPDYYPSQFSPVLPASAAGATTTIQIVNHPHNYQGAVASMSRKHRHLSLMPSEDFQLSRMEEFLLGNDSSLDTSLNLFVNGDGNHMSQNLFTGCSELLSNPSFAPDPTYECTLPASTASCGSGDHSSQNLFKSGSDHATNPSYPPGSSYEYPLPASTTSAFGSGCASQFPSDVYASNDQAAPPDVTDLWGSGDGPASLAPLKVLPVLPIRDAAVPLDVVSDPCGQGSATDSSFDPTLKTWIFQSEPGNGDSEIPGLDIVLPNSLIDPAMIGLDIGSSWENGIA